MARKLTKKEKDMPFDEVLFYADLNTLINLIENKNKLIANIENNIIIMEAIGLKERILWN
ncbi:MAG: hypothetical protein HZB54_03030 [Deltaproteobacteria bacterium]|nr:hypothetical protein [Deltaproteobacteria bacterium]